MFYVLAQQFKTEIVFGLCGMWFKHGWKGPEWVVLSFGEHSSQKQNLLKFHVFSQILPSCAAIHNRNCVLRMRDVIWARLERTRVVLSFCEHCSRKQTLVKFHRFSTFLRTCAAIYNRNCVWLMRDVTWARLENSWVSSFEFLWTQLTKNKIGEISSFFNGFAFFRSN